MWWWANDPQLSDAARQAVAGPDHEVWVSAASAREIATKQRIGKLPPLPSPASGFDGLVAAEGFRHLSVSASHAWQAGLLDWDHRDPFDRMLAAQARHEHLTLVARDPVFGALALPLRW